MTLQAWINSFGNNTAPPVRVTNHYSWWNYRGEQGDYDYGERFHPYQHAVKQGAKGNRVDPTRYYREIVEVVDDTPFEISEDYTWSDGTFREGSRSKLYISSGMPNLSVWEWPGGFQTRLSNLESRLNNSVRLKLRDVNNMQLGVAIAESKRTLDMLAGSASTLWSSMLALKRGNPRAALQALGFSGGRGGNSRRSLSADWLAIQYGWLPLMSDAHDLYTRLSDSLDTPQTFKVSVQGDTSYTYSPNPWETQEWEGSYKLGVQATIINDFAHELNGWGLINPLSIAWELVPFSFAIDWGIPIGNALESMSATAGLRFDRGFVNRKTSGTRFKQSNYSDQPNGERTLKVETRGSHVTKYQTFERYPMSGFPPPSLYGNENPFSSKRVANALALFRQLTK